MIHHLFLAFIDVNGLPIPIQTDVKGNAKAYCLEEQKRPKLPVIQFPNTPSNPKAVVVKLPYTFLTVFAVLWSVRHFQTAVLTEPFQWQCHFGNVFNWLHFFLSGSPFLRLSLHFNISGGLIMVNKHLFTSSVFGNLSIDYFLVLYILELIIPHKELGFIFLSFLCVCLTNKARVDTCSQEKVNA